MQSIVGDSLLGFSRCLSEREAHGPPARTTFFSGGASARLGPECDELMQLRPVGRAHGEGLEVV